MKKGLNASAIPPELGYVPEWYTLLQAARYLGVPPWELLAQCVIWKQWAVMAINAEAVADRPQGPA